MSGCWAHSAQKCISDNPHQWLSCCADPTLLILFFPHAQGRFMPMEGCSQAGVGEVLAAGAECAPASGKEHPRLFNNQFPAISNVFVSFSLLSRQLLCLIDFWCNSASQCRHSLGHQRDKEGSGSSVGWGTTNHPVSREIKTILMPSRNKLYGAKVCSEVSSPAHTLKWVQLQQVLQDLPHWSPSCLWKQRPHQFLWASASMFPHHGVTSLLL